MLKLKRRFIRDRNVTSAFFAKTEAKKKILRDVSVSRMCCVCVCARVRVCVRVVVVCVCVVRALKSGVWHVPILHVLDPALLYDTLF